VRINQVDLACKRCLLIRRVSKHHHLGRPAGEVFTFVGYIAECVAGGMHRAADIQFPAIFTCLIVPQFKVYIAKCLIRTGVSFAANPECVFVELDMLLCHTATYLAAQAAITKRQILFHPTSSRTLIPQVLVATCMHTAHQTHHHQRCHHSFHISLRYSQL